MADSELKQVRSPEPLTVSIIRAHNLRGVRGDTVCAYIKVEFGEKPLGETSKIDCMPDETAEYNYSTTINVTFEDALTLDEISCKPVVLTVLESLPKEKKQKEEKTAILGQVSIDLLPLLLGQKSHKYNLVLHSVPGSPLEQLTPDVQLPELEVEIHCEQALLTEAQLQDSNLMCVTAESLYAPPEVWNTAGHQYLYTAALPVPITAEKENTVVFAGGSLSAASSSFNRQKKWAVPGPATGSAVYIDGRHLAQDTPDEEDGDFKGKDDREHRQAAEHDKARVTWNIERRCYMDTTGTRSFQERIAKTRYYPVEIYRTALPSGAKGKKEDEGVITFHGIAYINLAPLLYPGVMRVRGAYKVVAFNELELTEKTGRKGSLAEESLKIATGILCRSSSSPFPKPSKATKEDSKAKEPKKGASDGASETDGQPAANVDGQQYTDAGSYFMLEVALQRPLVPKRQPEELARRVSEYIPPRPLFPKRTDGAERAVTDFHSEVASVANMVLDEFRCNFSEKMIGDELSTTGDQMEERRQKLIYHLNSSGKYFSFKEKLKHSVVKIVREKYLQTTNFSSENELQTFLSELYVYLVDQMHIGLGKVLNIEDQSPIPEPLTDSSQLKHFAREAEVNNNFDVASKYYQERIARDRNDPDHWLDYGTFSLYISDLTKAEECFKECVSIDQRHLHGLLLYGVVCAMQEKQDVAETFFEAATSVCPDSLLAWTMLGLFYMGLGNDIGAEMALLEAEKLNKAEAATAVRALRLEEQRQRAPPPPEPEAPATPVVPPEPAAEVLEAVHDQDSKGMGSKLNASRRGSIISAADHGGDVGETTPLREPTPTPTQTPYMQIMPFLLEVKAMPFTERALARELLAAGAGAHYHIALARLKLQQQLLPQAEDALNHSLAYDHQNPDAWAIMGHVKYLRGDMESAKDCYERTLSFVADASEMHSIYLRLASIYLQEAKFERAKRQFLMACKRSPSCVSWLGVGIACYRLGELSEAEDALAEANVLNNSDPEVWAYLSLVCLRTGRQLEAEQAYKYAVKLNLGDEELLGEIHSVQKDVGFGNPQL